MQVHQHNLWLCQGWCWYIKVISELHLGYILDYFKFSCIRVNRGCFRVIYGLLLGQCKYDCIIKFAPVLNLVGASILRLSNSCIRVTFRLLQGYGSITWLVSELHRGYFWFGESMLG